MFITEQSFMVHRNGWCCNKREFYKGIIGKRPYGPPREKTCLWGFWKIEFQASLLSYTGWLENWNFTCSKFKYDTSHSANNKGADQTVRTVPKTGFLTTTPIWSFTYNSSVKGHLPIIPLWKVIAYNSFVKGHLPIIPLWKVIYL